MDTISIAVIVVVGLIVLAILGLKLYSSIKLKGLRQTAIDLIVYAEEAFDKGMNNEKFQMVVQGIISCLPPVATVFINETTIKMFVQAVFDSIKSALDAQPKLPEVEEKTKEVSEEIEKNMKEEE
jgi:hypothetical protein